MEISILAPSLVLEMSKWNLSKELLEAFLEALPRPIQLLSLPPIQLPILPILQSPAVVAVPTISRLVVAAVATLKDLAGAPVSGWKTVFLLPQLVLQDGRLALETGTTE